MERLNAELFPQSLMMMTEEVENTELSSTTDLSL